MALIPAFWARRVQRSSPCLTVSGALSSSCSTFFHHPSASRSGPLIVSESEKGVQFGFRNLMNTDIKYLNFTWGTSSEVNTKFVSSISLYMKYTVFSPKYANIFLSWWYFLCAVNQVLSVCCIVKSASLMPFPVLCDWICGVRRHIQWDRHVGSHQTPQSQQPFLSKLLPQGPHPSPGRPEGHVSPLCCHILQPVDGCTWMSRNGLSHSTKPSDLRLSWLFE